ncbi:unnamed protein product [Caenorhabditis auriculariae]|uniref:Major facilitator superfamily (MFS) profile domain-containing protein n=1 Tax=Caenorhabditis auriculariae TaxID=2777116 RepID=A0A8S1HE65_9PELO|nr:unnamed protein product [Caenorhabditis auriculariae]
MFFDKFRFLLLGICFVCLTSVLSNYIIINFTFICMKDDPSGLVDLGNGTYHNKFDYSVTEKSWIVWAVAAGTILGTGPINYGYIRFGARWPFFIAGITSVTATFLTPVAASSGLPFLLVLRFAQGLAYAADFAAIGIMCVRWAPLSQTGLFIAVLTSFTPVATAVSNAATGWLCSSSLGWRSSYYIHASISLVAFVLWITFYHDDPQVHKSVSDKELAKIQKDKTQAHIERDSFVPYWEIIKNKVILTVWANAFSEMVSVTVLLTYSPLYFRKVLQFSIVETGIMVSLSAAVHIPVKWGAGFLSDKLTWDEKYRMWLFNTTSVGLCGVFCFAIAFAWRFFAIIYGLMGTNCGGFYKCGTLASRQYAHFVLAMIQFMKCIALFVAPAMVAVFVSDEESHQQWGYVYIVNGIILIVVSALFIPMATDKPQAFTNITRTSKTLEKYSTSA